MERHNCDVVDEMTILDFDDVVLQDVSDNINQNDVSIISLLLILWL